MSDWRAKAGAKDDWRSKAKSPIEQLVGADAKKRLLEGIKGTGIGLPPEEQENLADFPGMARSALSGVTRNAAPHILAAMEAAKKLPTFSSSEEIDDARARELPDYQREYGLAREKHPFANVVGAVASPDPLSKAKAAGLVGKLALGAGRVGTAAAGGVAANRLGGGEQSDLEAGALPAAIQAGAEAISPLAGRFGAGLKKFARGRSLATLSPSKADIGKLNQLGIADDVADDLYKSGGFGFASNTSGVADRLSKIVPRRGKALGNIIDDLDRATGDATTMPSEAASRVRQMSADEFGASPAYRGKAALAEREAKAIETQYGGAPMSLRKSEEVLKRGYDDEALKRISAEAKGAAPSPKTDALALVREAIKKQNEDAAEVAANAVAPELAGKFVPAKQAYGRMAEAQRIAEKTGGPKQANRVLSPSDYGFGIASGQAYGGSALADAVTKPGAETLTGMLASIAHNQLRTRGSSAAAHIAYPASKAVQETVSRLNQTPAGSAALARLLEQLAQNDEDGKEKP